MMDYKTIGLQVFAIMVTYIIANIPVALAATQVNIYPSPSSSSPSETAMYDSGKVVNFNAQVVKRYGTDEGGAGLKIWVMIDGASEIYTVKKIFLYMCRGRDPLECSRLSPETFDTYVDTHLEWEDISEKVGRTFYPQISHLMAVVKLERTQDGQTMIHWASVWHEIIREDFNAFTQYTHELPQMDVYANSPDMVEAIRSYIENSVMIPMNWLSKVVLRGARGRYSIGANGEELEVDKPDFQGVGSAGIEIEAINKEFYFVFPNLTSGVAIPITLNQNPSFECGDGRCDRMLGESEITCCLDCGCAGDYYCDWPESSSSRGSCRNPDAIGITVSAPSISTVRDCDSQIEETIMVNVNNAPSSIDESLHGTLYLGDSRSTVTCEGGPVTYECPIMIESPIECGDRRETIGPNRLNLVVTFSDGEGTRTINIEDQFDNIMIPYYCVCDEGRYCDPVEFECKTDIMSLTANPEEQPIRDFTRDSSLSITLTVNNPPSNVHLTDDVSADMYLNIGESTVKVSGAPSCSSASGQFTWNCRIPISISGYSQTQRYIIENNEFHARFTFSDGLGQDVQRDLTDSFDSIIIESIECGNNFCDLGEENPSTYCCADCGCAEGQYCDGVYQCISSSDSNFELSLNTMSPSVITDCEAGHVVALNLEIDNTANTDYTNKPPSDMVVESCHHLVNGDLHDYTLLEECVPIHGIQSGRYNCSLLILPINDCELDTPNFDPAPGEGGTYYIGGSSSNNEISCDISFIDSHTGVTLNKVVSGSIDPIELGVVYHCGDGVCESDIGEDYDNCCIDCSCGEAVQDGYLSGELDDWYCDWGIDEPEPYVCKEKSDITLRVIPGSDQPISRDSCEVTNEIQINAIVESESGRPMQDDMRVTGYWAVIGGQKSDYFVCSPNPDDPLSYECLLKILPTDDCTSKTSGCLGWNHPSCDTEGDCAFWNYAQCLRKCDKSTPGCTDEVDINPGVCIPVICTDECCETMRNCNCQQKCSCIGGEADENSNKMVYKNNEVVFKVNLWDGETRIPYELTGELGDITITQNVRTMYDIAEDGTKLLFTQVEALQVHMQKMMEAMGKCYKLLFTALILSLAVSLIGPVFKFTNIGEGDTYWKRLKSSIGFTKDLGGTITGTISMICSTIQSLHQLTVESFKMNIEMIKMDLCIQIEQHAIDTGGCENNPESCFNSLLSCFNFDDIDDSFDRMNKITDEIEKNVDDTNKLWSDFADEHGDPDPVPPGNFGFTVYCNGRPYNINKGCCEYASTTATGSSDQCAVGEIEFVVKRPDYIDCEDLQVEHFSKDYDFNHEYDIRDVFGPPEGASGSGHSTETVELWCRDDDTKYTEPIADADIEYLNGFEAGMGPSPCTCNEPPDGSPSQIPQIIYTERIYRDDNKIKAEWTTDEPTTNNVFKLWTDELVCTYQYEYLTCATIPGKEVEATSTEGNTVHKAEIKVDDLPDDLAEKPIGHVESVSETTTYRSELAEVDTGVTQEEETEATEIYARVTRSGGLWLKNLDIDEEGELILDTTPLCTMGENTRVRILDDSEDNFPARDPGDTKDSPHWHVELVDIQGGNCNMNDHQYGWAWSKHMDKE